MRMTVTFIDPLTPSLATRVALRPTLLPLKEKRNTPGNIGPPHVHHYFEQLIIVRRGGGTMMLEDGRYPFRGPGILVVPSLTVHGFAFEENTDRWVVTVAKSYLQEITTRAPEFAEIFALGDWIGCREHEREYMEFEHVLAKLDWEQKRSARCREIITEALLIDLLVGVLRKVQHSRTREVSVNGSYQEVHRRFTQMVEEHHAENWSLQKFADALRISVSRLRTVCQSVSGESPIRIINTRRVVEAKRCLTYTNMSVSQIAYQLGFEDPSYFSRFFRARCGQTPSLYKAR